MASSFEQKNLKITLLTFLFVIPFFGISQYTNVINSNRPGQSVSAFAVGKNVVQLEAGLLYEQQDHSLLNTQSNIWATEFSLRYGLLFERLEINWEGIFQNQDITFANNGTEDSYTNFSRNRIGLKFLVFDPFINPKRANPNLYSWKANNKFILDNLVPAISVYAGVNYLFGDNPFYVGDPNLSYRAMVATQSRLTPRFVLITNFAYDRISTDFPEMSYLVSLSHAFRNPKWSVFIENQGIKSDRYADNLLRGGVAHLLSERLQADINLGASFKNTPSRVFISLGASYRFDFHKDPEVSIDEQKAGQNGGPIKKNSMKKKKKEKNKGSGAEDIDLGPSKKQLKKLKKEEKKKAKNKKKEKDDGVIEF
ncbi:transporter [uncultured Maribacter sp.]|uniref:transporter n=1 Tax=uncultured Maribacter sp. TaxID=431308 RepID=UPI00262CB257|nr:transporter [uncultured Maribacter sp.]